MWGYTFMLLRAISLELTLIHAAALSYICATNNSER
jgi:hypothetical protein